MSAHQQRLVTLEEYASMPERAGMIDDLIAGEVVYRPLHSVPHGLASGKAGFTFSEYCQSHGGTAALRCGMTVARNPDTVVSADAVYWRVQRSILVEQWWPSIPPLAAFEVVDTGEQHAAMMRRVGLLVGFGIGVLWLVDPIEEFVTEFRGNSVRHFPRDATLEGETVLPGFSCKVSDLFA